MLSEAKKQSMALDGNGSVKAFVFRWKVKWRMENLGALGTMGVTAPLTSSSSRLADSTAGNLMETMINYANLI